MSKGISQKTKKLTLGAIFAAIGVVMLTLGSLVEVLDLSMAAVASMLCILAVIELGGAYPWLIFTTTSLLSIVLYPSGTACWLYLIFFGYYPIVKEKIERLPKAVAWILKLALFNVSVLAYVAIAYFLFFGGANAGSLKDAFTSVVGGADAGFTLAIALYAVLNLVFILYDVAMTRIISFYFIKLRHRLKLFK